MRPLLDIFRNFIGPLGERNLSEVIALSAIGHLLVFFAINFGAWLLPSRLEPLPTGVEIVSEQQLQQRLSQFRARSQQSVKLESKKATKQRQGEKRQEPAKDKKPEVKDTKTDAQTKQKIAKKSEVAKEQDKTKTKTTATATEKTSEKARENTDPIDDILSSLSDDLSSDGSEPENDFSESLDEALADDFTDEPSFLSSEQILTPSELSAFRKHIFTCWSPPIGAPSLENLVVDLYLTLDSSAYVVDVRVIDKARMSRDPFFRSAAEAALRTLSDSACSPLKLPLSKHSLWSRTILRFDPRRLFGL